MAKTTKTPPKTKVEKKPVSRADFIERRWRGAGPAPLTKTTKNRR